MATISEGYGMKMIDPRVYSERYTRIMWKRNPIMMAEKAHCYPCCDVPTDKKCTGCEYPASCQLRREHGRIYPHKVMCVGGRSRELNNLLSNWYGIAAAGLLDMPFLYKNPRVMGSSLFRIKTKPSNPCLLPGCHNTTTHNGGYCCAEHCKEHRARQKSGFYA